MSGWIAVDLDGTLAEYHGWPADGSIGRPIPAMVERVKGWLAEGREVRIFTARIWPLGVLGAVTAAHVTRLLQTSQLVAIERWCLVHLGRVLTVTCIKDPGMIELWDDRAVQVIPNTGQPVIQQRE